MPTKQTPGQIKYFLKHTIFIGNEAKTHVIAFVSWFLEHPVLKDYYGKPVEVWHHTSRQSTGSASFTFGISTNFERSTSSVNPRTNAKKFSNTGGIPTSAI